MKHPMLPIAVLALAAMALGAPARSQANPEVTDPVPLADCQLEGNDSYPQIAMDGSGVYLAVWQSTATLDDTIGDDLDILVSRSLDDGVTWTARAPLNTNAETDSAHDSAPQIATDGAGHWVAVWQSHAPYPFYDDIVVARSSDGGVHWTPPATISPGATGGEPQIATDGAGHWVAVWSTQIGGDADIVASRSSDRGATWTAPLPLTPSAYIDRAVDNRLQLATDGAGVWLAIWGTYDRLGGPYGSDTDLLVSRSIDQGATWSEPTPLNNAATDGGVGDVYSHLTSDRAGHWVAVWEAGDGSPLPGHDENILVSRSSDGGITWSAPEILNTNAATDTENDQSPSVTTDGRGLWVAVWHASNLYNDDKDILMARSRDQGVTWTAPVRLNTNAATDSWYDWNPQLATAGKGRWVAVWHAQGGGLPFDVLTAQLTFCDLSLDGVNPTTARFPPPSRLVSGSLSQLRASGSFAGTTCVGSYPSTPSQLPPGNPPSGDGWYFLARGGSQCASYRDSGRSPDPRDDLDLNDPCP